ncbi:tRNA threonylcarbamoyladenosine dehydratase [Chloropicon primus]|uniref:THIF-type NAD/FAD binding fold domain-containing protein n=3 Tax=Chloropicon primus TaxID=1764295 RepID=A0A5B8MG55_9CHLO|nr:hypothetical protein A3770_01p08300 [Chloropicon primus]UPQ97523.1 tRNA threonylcarbamoyladenosine dehydratase [Chloropicon primus]|eukprot:QDZ18312.1 hypothetical protein A3770_01p08300 [Chloropicon primus]
MAMAESKTFAIGLAAGVAASFLAWKCLGSDRVALSLARLRTSPGASPARENRNGTDGEASVHQGKGKAALEPAVPMAEVLTDEVLKEQLTRNIQFFGESAQLDLANAFVVVVGLGGVGSHAAHFLLRSGVGKLRLVDFDQVTLSSLNRHALATRSDVGTPKATCLKDRFSEICPECEVEALVSLFDESTREEVLKGKPDFVIDAIDNIHTKVQLLMDCKERGIEVLCVCGAGGKADPTRLKIADIAESSIDPLGRAVRYQLKNKYKFEGRVPALFSTENPRCGLLPFDEAQGDPLDFQIVPNFRVRTIPVLGTTPAIFGMAAAAYVLTFLTGRPLIPEPLFKIRLSEIEVLFERLKDREDIQFGTSDGVHVDLDEVEYLVRSVWCGCCAFVLAKGPLTAAKKNKGLWRNTNELALVRWDETKPCTMENLVLVHYNVADDHAEAGLEATREAHPKEAEFIEQRLLALRHHLGSTS